MAVVGRACVMDRDGVAHPALEPVTWGHLERELMHLRELVSRSETAAQRALALQAAEYERRLDALNHAHDTAAENWRRSLPRETYDSFKEEYSREREKTGLELERAKQRVDTVAEDLRRSTEEKAAAVRTANERANMVTRVLVALLALALAIVQYATRMRD